MSQDNCVYCNATAESVVWSDARCRVLHVTDATFAGFCRVVWGTHVAEFSDLDDAARTHVMRVVAGVEKGLRDLLAPDKVNLASLGNLVPHLHWHVIPRYRNDPRWGQPIWATPLESMIDTRLPAAERDALVLELRRAFDTAAA